MGNRTTLNRALSKLGLCSRTDAIKYIQDGKVTVNNKVVTKSLAWVDIELDKIKIDQVTNKSCTNSQQPQNGKKNIYLAMYKPRGFVTTKLDEHGRKTVYDLLPDKYKTAWLFPVGRLDKDSQGLLLFTNDGAWQDQILAPETHLEKTYLVWTEDPLSPGSIAKLQRGIRLANDDLQTCVIIPQEYKNEPTAPDQKERKIPNVYKITISEGKNRQIRKMMAYIGTTVVKLERIQIGKLSLENLNLKPREVKEIKPSDI